MGIDRGIYGSPLNSYELDYQRMALERQSQAQLSRLRSITPPAIAVDPGAWATVKKEKPNKLLLLT